VLSQFWATIKVGSQIAKKFSFANFGAET